MDETNTRRHLADLLAAAEAALGDPTIDDAWASLSIGEFRRLLADSRTALLAGRLSHAAAWELWSTFAPTCDWDELGGDPDLGNAIFELMESLYGRPTELG